MVIKMGREKQDSEYLLKLAALNEFESALKYKKVYEELTHGFLGLVKEILRYCEKNRIAIPDEATYYRITVHAQSLILSRVTPAVKHQRRTPEDEAEP
jgi:hypothetical protein